MLSRFALHIDRSANAQLRINIRKYMNTDALLRIDVGKYMNANPETRIGIRIVPNANARSLQAVREPCDEWALARFSWEGWYEVLVL